MKHTRTVRVLVLTIALALAGGISWARGSSDSQARVLATTAWTAAFVRAAGVKDVRTLAPYEIQHPAEYELKPSDIEAVGKAELIVFAGYEVMVKRLKEIADGPALLAIQTDHSMATLSTSIRAIAEAMGTTKDAEKALVALSELYQEWRSDIKASSFAESPVVTHIFQKPLVEELGMRVVGVFGPAPLEATQIRNLAEKMPVLIIDNIHNPIAAPLAEAVPDARVVVFRNFPESSRNGEILDVLRFNQSALAKEMLE